MVTPAFPPDVGGIQTYSFQLARQFDLACSRFAVLAPRRRGCRAVDAKLPFLVHRRWEPGDHFAFSAIRPIGRLLREGGFDAIFSTHWTTAYAAIKACRRRRTPVFCAAHGMELLNKPLARTAPLQRAYDGIRSVALREVSQFFPVSRFTAELLKDEGVPPDRLTVATNGVDPDVFVPESSARAPSVGKRLLTVARLVPRKGIDRVIRCLPAILRRVGPVEYVVVGEGPDRPRLMALAEETGVADAVRFAGQCSEAELVQQYQSCDVFVLPASSSDHDVEGFGLSILEASACGKPVVGSTEGGIPDAIIHRHTGLIVSLSDAVALERSLVDLLTDEAQAATYGANGRRHAVKSSWASCSQQMLSTIARSSERR